MISFEGKHGAIINLFTKKIMEGIDFNPNSKFDRSLLNATLIKASNKLELYCKETIKTEIEVFQCKTGLAISYEDFILLDEPYKELWLKYPELVNLTNKLFEDLQFNFNLIKIRFNASLPNLIAEDFFKHPDEISNIFYMNGESHDNNKNVVVFYKDKKPTFCLKLRSVEIEAKINDLIVSFSRDFLGLNNWEGAVFIAEKDWGWMKWVNRNDFDTAEKVGQYYLNFGSLLAICSALNITDLHYENIIAGINPIPIDLETSLHCNNPDDTNPKIIRTSLLPHTLKYLDGKVSIEHSGLGNIFEDLQYENGSLRGNSVQLNGNIVSPFEYINNISEGFKRTYKCIEENKRIFFDFLDSIKHLKNRVLFNATDIYYTILKSSMHPKLLRDTQLRKDYIRDCLINDRRYHNNNDIVLSEINSLMRGDVPRFTNDVFGTNIYNNGNFITKNKKGIECGYEYVKNSISKIDDASINKENMDLVSLLMQCGEIVLATSNLRDEEYSLSNNLMLIQLEKKIKLYLNRISKKDKNLKLFLAFNDNGLEYRELPLDIFNGISGVVYIQIKNLIDEKSLNAEIIDIYNKYVEFLNKNKTFNLGGAFIGDLSCLLPLILSYGGLSENSKSEISLLLGNVDLYLKSGNVKFPGGSGMLGGVSGLMALTALYYNETQDNRWKELSIDFFNTLMSESTQMDGMLLFPYPNQSSHRMKCLSGLSHGQAGIAYCLSLYGLIFKNEKDKCSKLIEQTIRFEIENYDDKLLNWKDLRLKILNEEAVHDFSWAHGGAGILYCMDFILKNYKIETLENFYLNLDINEIFTKNINERKVSVNYSISNGHLGASLIYKRMNPMVKVSLPNFNDKAKFNAITGLGLFKGIAGEYLAIKELSENNLIPYLPLLPHELFKFDWR